MVVQLVPGTPAKEAATAALPVIRRLVQAMKSQKKVMQNLANLPDAVKHWNVGPPKVPEQTAE